MEDKKRTMGSHMSTEHNASKGATASHSASHASKSHASTSHKGTMSHEQAGRLGGEAHHTCRGRGCDENKGHSAKAASHASSSSNKSASVSDKNNNDEKWND